MNEPKSGSEIVFELFFETACTTRAHSFASATQGISICPTAMRNPFQHLIDAMNVYIMLLCKHVINVYLWEDQENNYQTASSNRADIVIKLVRCVIHSAIAPLPYSSMSQMPQMPSCRPHIWNEYPPSIHASIQFSHSRTHSSIHEIKLICSHSITCKMELSAKNQKWTSNC